jgi:hypothetical protein
LHPAYNATTAEEDQDQDRNNRLGKMSHRMKDGRREDNGKKLISRSCGKTEMDGKAWLSNNSIKEETP